jgi:hypothetical protein
MVLLCGGWVGEVLCEMTAVRVMLLFLVGSS